MSIDLAYAELGLSPGASESEVRAAWRRLVSRWHPDRNKSADAVDLMKRINSAYERIRESAAFGGSGQRESTTPDTTTKPAPDATPKAEAQGRVVRRRLRLSLEEAALGSIRVMRGKLTDTCVACEGHGVLKPAARCSTCEGSGTVRDTAWFGWLSTRSICGSCAGSGTVRRTCRICAGQGKSTSAYRITVRIPAGVRHGDVLSARGAGDSNTDFDGTLELQVEIAPHQFFVVDEDGSLRCEMPVDGFAWIADAWVDVPTLTGLHKMRLKRGRHVYRLRGQGLPLERRGTERGDYLVTVVPTFPDDLSDRQQALLEQLASASSHTACHDAKGPMRAWQGKVQAWERRRPRAKTEGGT